MATVHLVERRFAALPPLGLNDWQCQLHLTHLEDCSPRRLFEGLPRREPAARTAAVAIHRDLGHAPGISRSVVMSRCRLARSLLFSQRAQESHTDVAPQSLTPGLLKRSGSTGRPSLPPLQEPPASRPRHGNDHTSEDCGERPSASCRGGHAGPLTLRARRRTKATLTNLDCVLSMPWPHGPALFMPIPHRSARRENRLARARQATAMSSPCRCGMRLIQLRFFWPRQPS
jgi:hypothetical protein